MYRAKRLAADRLPPCAAVQACQAALSLDPGYHDAHKELIKALLADKQYEEAVNTARNLLQQHQNDGELHQVNLASS